MQQTAPRSGFFDATDGLKLYQDWYLPAEDKAPRAGLVIVHGFGEHGGRYALLAREMSARGFAAMTYDYRGHGQAGGKRGHCDHFTEYLDDLDRACASARSALGKELPLVLIAQSHGGLIALRTICEPSRIPAGVKAAVLTSPFLGLALKVPAVKVVAAKLASRLLPRLTMPSGLDANHFSHDPAVAPAYLADRWNHHVATSRWFTEMQAAQAFVFEHAPEITMPTLWLLAGDDQIVSTPTAQKVYETAGGEKAIKVYPGLYHELYNEVEKAKVEADLFAWLDSRFS